MSVQALARDGWAKSIFYAVGIVALPIVLAACGGGSSGSTNPDPGPDPTPLPRAVTASPPGGTYEPGTTQNVVLSVRGEDSDGATIYYTTDLTEPTDGSTPYTAPIPVATDTVVKFFARWADATDTSEVREGYVFTPAGSTKAQLAASGHGKLANESWRHWDPGGPFSSCARCHSSGGFNQWALGDPVTANAASPGLLDCVACHGDPAGAFPSIYSELETYLGLRPVEFPSGVGVSVFEASNICMGCHQGRTWAGDVESALAAAPPWGFQNVHYYPAAATYWGTRTNGGYHYVSDSSYADRNTFPSHPEGYNTCVGCHMGAGAPHDHTFQPNLAVCTGCHGGTSFPTLGGSPSTNYAKLRAAETQLLGLITARAATLSSGPIEYRSNYPYWFNPDTGSAYQYDDPALFKACYNYQFSHKDPCGYIHNGTYVRQVLHDTIVDLGGTPDDVPPGRAGTPGASDVYAAKTEEFSQSGHAHVGAEAYRHWDVDYTEDEYNPAHPDYDPNQPIQVPSQCAKCHSAYGYTDWIADGTTDEDASVLTVIGCIACHRDANLFADASTVWSTTNPQLEPVTFPSGLTATLNGPSNICMSCHQGRESGASVDDTIAATPGGPHSFVNIHYYAAAASFFGSGVGGGYEYSTLTYDGPRDWIGHASVGFDTCVGCHMRGSAMDHRLVPQVSDCTASGCHTGATFETLDFNVGTNYTNIQTLLGELDAAIRAYAAAKGLPWIGYDYAYHEYPYFFRDTNTNGVIDLGENIYPNRYLWFDDSLLQAAYNLQFGLTEPCGYIHNGAYVQQCLYDSIRALGGTPSVARP